MTGPQGGQCGWCGAVEGESCRRWGQEVDRPCRKMQFSGSETLGTRPEWRSKRGGGIDGFRMGLELMG